MKKLNSRTFLNLMSLSLALVVCASARAAEFGASAWRGETAYVEIPQAFQDDMSNLPSGVIGNDVSFTLLRFDEVALLLLLIAPH